MTGRDTVFALGAIVIALAIATVLLVGSMAAGADESGRSRFFFVNFGNRVAPVRTAVAAGDVPVPLRAVVPFQRGVSDTARDATFLGGVVLLGALASGFREAPAAIQFGLQVGLMTMAVFAAGLLLVAFIGFAAASWRLGDAIFGLRGMSRWAGGIPGPLVALIGATILYVLVQLPAVGGLIAFIVIAYALGAVVVARLGTAPASIVT